MAWYLRFTGVVLSLLCVTVGYAQSVSDFYHGKTITLEVGYAPGGGYDIYARVFAKYFGLHLPGSPAVVVRNVPGAGSLKLANQNYNVDPRDGTFIASIGREQITAPLFKVPGTQFDPTKINWLGTLDRAISLCAASSVSGIEDIEQTRSMEMLVGGTGPASLTVVLPIALRELLGYRIKVISGYPGGNEVALAMDRGEVQARCAWSYASLMSTHPDWIREGKLRVLAIVGRSRLPEFPNAPTILELAKSSSDRQVLALIMASEEIARPFMAPPGVPEERLGALREAFTATVRDPDFLAEARSLDMQIDPMDWREMTDEIAALYMTSDTLVQRAVSLFGQ